MPWGVPLVGVGGLEDRCLVDWMAAVSQADGQLVCWGGTENW